MTTDVCISINRPEKWNDKDKLAQYRQWVKDTMDPSTYYFPRNSRKIHFANMEDLVVFKIVFGDVYTTVDSIDMSTVEHMIVMERYYRNT